MDRVIYIIPYISIIDQNAALTRSVLEGDAQREGIVLEHHSNLTPDKQTWQASLLAENWDAPVIFTTSVQFLDTLFSGGTRAVRRMHQLANAVIIFDEIQTLPLKTVHLFNNAINFLVKECGSTVVFCTATQPLLDTVDKIKGAARLTDKPEMAPHHERLFEQLRRVNVLDGRRAGGWNEDEIAELVCQQAAEAGSALVVVNTKAEAIAIYALCRHHLRNVLHLSTNMCPAHRMKIITNLREKLAVDGVQSEPLVCVSTQLIEAGVDLDFGVVIRYLAGLDSIGQAAGRCNRNGRRPSGNVTIVNPSRENLTMLPEIAVGRAIAERVLDEYRQDPGAFDNNLLSPKAMKRYYEYYFYERSKEMVYPVSAKQVGHDDNLLSLLSTNALSVQAYVGKHRRAPLIPLRQSFKSAGSTFEVIDAPTEGILVPYGKDGEDIITSLCAERSLDRMQELLREAQRYSVNLFPRDRDKLAQEHRIHETQNGSGVFYLDRQYYDDKDLGVLFGDKNYMEFLNG